MKGLGHFLFLLSVWFVSKDLDFPADYTVFSTYEIIFLTVHVGWIYLS